jgi:hypothetical protein
MLRHDRPDLATPNLRSCMISVPIGPAKRSSSVLYVPAARPAHRPAPGSCFVCLHIQRCWRTANPNRLPTSSCLRTPDSLRCSTSCRQQTSLQHETYGRCPPPGRQQTFTHTSVPFKAAASRPDTRPFLIPARLPFCRQALSHPQFHIQLLSNAHPRTEFSVRKPNSMTLLSSPPSNLQITIPSTQSRGPLSLLNFPPAHTTDPTSQS